MDLGKLGRGEQLAAAGGIVLLFSVLFLDWYDVAGFGVGFSDATSGLKELIVWVTMIVAIGLGVAKATSNNVNLPVAASALTAGLGILAFVLIAFRIIDPPGPDGVGRSLGLFVGTVGAALIAYGGYESMQEEGTTFAGEADRLQDRFDGGDDDQAAGGPPA